MNSFLKKNSITLCTLHDVKHISQISEFCSDIPKDKLHFYRMEITPSRICLFLHIPEKQTPPLDHFLLLGKKQVFILSETNKDLLKLKEHLQKISDAVSGEKSIDSITMPEFLCLWLRSFLLEDLVFIHRSEKEISVIEEEILKETEENIHPRLLKSKQSVSRLYRYYNQMIECTDELLIKKEKEFSVKEQKNFEDYKLRLNHLLEETKFLREYLMEVQELYQTEIDIRQNHIMKTLSIIATIFFPLSLISGWYGMNFQNMPELKNPHSYPVITGVSVLIVIFCLLFFKKKKYW